MIFFKQLEIGPMANYVYLIGDPQTRQCAVVDPAWDAPAILEAIQREGYRLGAALVTHNHYDHVNGIPDLLKAADIPVYVHRQDAPGVLAGGNLKAVEGGDCLRLGTLEISFLHTPGHTAGSQCLRVGAGLVTGDTLFIDGCGRVDLPTSDPEAMAASLRRLAGLPPETVIWPGHNYAALPSAAMGAQLSSNPYLKAARRGLAEFLRLVGS